MTNKSTQFRLNSSSYRLGDTGLPPVLSCYWSLRVRQTGVRSDFLKNLRGRGLKGTELFVTDKCQGLVESVGEIFPEARWQRCVVHWYRNVLRTVPKTKWREVAAMLKAIHAQEDRAAALRKAHDVHKKLLAMKLTKAAQIMREGVEETLAYMSFPREHWLKIRTTNPLERINREIRRRTRVVGAFPDGNAAVLLVAARLRHIAGTRSSRVCFFRLRFRTCNPCSW